ncbi:DUF418 domain-containing protein [Bradyrhizobium sp. 187]|uniref:DUF418 domain-containing protein n=1 Tax=Bradyrhizobium sp. 187 TaxID=2782655 RepID=UPI001FFFA3ED|nr:DUF418 domain-containing protein [Bradyrhizobium sp. 187]
MLAVDMKAFALYSLLFGVGLAIQYEHLSTNPHRALLLFRRLIALLTFGLIHLFLIWNGDILTEYAIAGLVVLPFLFGPRWLLSCGAATFLALYLAMQVWSPPGLFPSLASLQRHVLEANQVYAGGSFGQVLAFRVSEIPVIVPLHIYVFPRTIGLFSIGALVWRSNALRKRDRPLLFLTAISCTGLGAVLILLRVSGVVAGVGLRALATPTGTILLAFGYGAMIIAVADLANGKRLLGWAARAHGIHELPRSVHDLWLDFLRIRPRAIWAARGGRSTAIGLFVYVCQVFVSGWWLDRYRYGPVEWLWRTLMYGILQPMSHDRLTSSSKRPAEVCQGVKGCPLQPA